MNSATSEAQTIKNSGLRHVFQYVGNPPPPSYLRELDGEFSREDRPFVRAYDGMKLYLSSREHTELGGIIKDGTYECETVEEIISVLKEARQEYSDSENMKKFLTSVIRAVQKSDGYDALEAQRHALSSASVPTRN